MTPPIFKDTFQGTFTGVRILVTDMGTDRVQVRFPRSKRKRVRRKWARDERNWRVTPTRGIYCMGDTFYCDAHSYAELQASLAHAELQASLAHAELQASLAPVSP